MPRRWILIMALVGLSNWVGGASALDGHEYEAPGSPQLARNLRTWTHASGRHRLRGSFVATHGDQVQVRGEDGGLTDIKLQALSAPDRAWIEEHRAELGRLNTGSFDGLLARRQPGPDRRDVPRIWQHFQPFASALTLRWDDDYVFVESDGLPDHRMMVGITAWQQQVPLPQPYTGANAWRIPLHPVPAKRPMSAKEGFFRGAIALAVNGVPIFNPIKNDGRTDTLLAGELDEFGGHCGRADDYHYHIAPVHLGPKAGKGNPLAYALDGYPIYGFDEPDGSKARPLDAFNGHEDGRETYHYHATKAYPYLNGGFHGEVTERGGQVDPQPRAEPVREALPPLRGATITDFRSPKAGSYGLTYEMRGRKHFVNYALAQNGSLTFQFADDTGKTTTATYRLQGGAPGDQAEGGRGAGRPRGPGDQPPPQGNPTGRRPPPRDEGRRPPPPLMAALDKDQDGELSATEIAGASAALLTLDRDKDGMLSAEELRPESPPDGPPPPEDGRRPPLAAGDRPPPRGEAPQGQRGPALDDPDRRPWIQVHAAEMDANRDGALTRQELLDESDRTFAGYDRDKDGKLSRVEYEGPGGVRSAMGGFVKQHAREIDADGDGVITGDELRANSIRMLERADRNRDGTLDADELTAPTPPAPTSGAVPPGGRRPQAQERRKGAQEKGKGQGQPNQAGGRPPG